MSLNTRIKEARLNSGLTQEQLGRCIGVAKTTVAGYEKNREPDAVTIGLIMLALKVDANYLFQDEMKEISNADFSISEPKTKPKYRCIDEHYNQIIMFNSVQYIRGLCRDREIPISKLEKECGFANGYLNPKKLKKIPYERALIIAKYLGIDINDILNGPLSSSDTPDPSNIVKDTDEKGTLESFKINNATLFHNNLRKIRVQKGMSQKDVARKIGVAKSTYSLYESGNREPNLVTIKRIVSALNISADELLGIDNYDSSMIVVHFDNKVYTEDELEEIKRFAEFIISKRK